MPSAKGRLTVAFPVHPFMIPFQLKKKNNTSFCSVVVLPATLTQGVGYSTGGLEEEKTVLWSSNSFFFEFESVRKGALANRQVSTPDYVVMLTFLLELF